MFQLHNEAGRVKVQVLHFSGGVTLQVFDHESGGNRMRGTSVNLLGAQAEELADGLKQAADESRKVGTDGSG